MSTEIRLSTYITYAEVAGSIYTAQDLFHDLSQLSVEDCLMLISRILIVLDNNGYADRDTQLHLAEHILQPPLFSQVRERISQATSRLVFFEPQLLYLAKHAILHARREAANNFGSGSLFHHFSRAILGVNDLLIRDPHTWGLKELQEEGIRSLYFGSRPDFVRSLARVYELFVLIPPAMDRQPYDLQEVFRAATGLPILDFIDMGFALIASSVQQRLGNLADDRWFIEPSNYFDQARLSQDEIENLFKQFATDVESLSKIYTSMTDDSVYNHKGLVQRPLVTFDGRRYFALSQRYIKEKLTRQIYWIIFDRIKSMHPGNDGKLREYSSFMGHVFEEYVYRLLRRIYPDSPHTKRLIREIEYRVGRQTYRTSDNILVYDGTILLMDTKVSQLQVYQTGILGNIDAFKRDIAKIVVEALKTVESGMICKKGPARCAG